MADESPGIWTRVSDDILKVAVALYDVGGAGAIGSMRHVYELITNMPAGDTQQVIGHNHGQLKSGENGVTMRDSPFTWSGYNDTADYVEQTILNSAGWVEVLNFRTNWGPFQVCAWEWLIHVTSGDGVLWRLSHADAVDNANVTWGIGSDTTHQLQTVTPSAPSSPTWVTLSGQIDAAGDTDVELLPIWTQGDDGAISPTDFQTMLSRREFLLEANSPVGDTVIRLYAGHLFAALTSDDLD